MGTIHRLMEAKKAERQEQGKDAGFSLIELIIVVVILGILVAVAIPIFAGIQQQAKDNSLKSIASSAASAVAAGMALQPPTVTALGAVPATVYKSADATLTITQTLSLDGFCVTASAVANGALDGAAATAAGPGCP